MPPCHRPGSHQLGPPQKGLPRERPPLPGGACCTCVFVDFWQAWAKAAWVTPALAWMKVGVPGHFLQEPHVHCLFCRCAVVEASPRLLPTLWALQVELCWGGSWGSGLRPEADVQADWPSHMGTAGHRGCLLCEVTDIRRV